MSIFVKVKKLGFIFISLLTIVLSIGNFGIFSLFLNQYKSNVQANINNKTSVVTDVIYINPYQLYSDSKNITWEDNNKEIVYNGELYDIISIESENGKVKISAISDKKETEYKIAYAQKEDVNNQSSNSPLKLLKQFFCLKCISINKIDILKLESKINLFSEHTDSRCFILNNGYKSLEVPPPNSFI